MLSKVLGNRIRPSSMKKMRKEDKDLSANTKDTPSTNLDLSNDQNLKRRPQNAKSCKKLSKEEKLKAIQGILELKNKVDLEKPTTGILGDLKEYHTIVKDTPELIQKINYEHKQKVKSILDASIVDKSSLKVGREQKTFKITNGKKAPTRQESLALNQRVDLKSLEPNTDSSNSMRK